MANGPDFVMSLQVKAPADAPSQSGAAEHRDGLSQACRSVHSRPPGGDTGSGAEMSGAARVASLCPSNSGRERSPGPRHELVTARTERHKELIHHYVPRDVVTQ